MQVVRIIGSAFIALIAFTVLVAGKPAIAGEAISTGTIESALADDATNQLLADSAPQQAAANGWSARDLLEINAYQNLDNRIEILAFLGVLELCLLGATSRIGSKDSRQWQRMIPVPGAPWGGPPPMPQGGGIFSGPQLPQAFGQGNSARPTSYSGENGGSGSGRQEMQ